MGACRGKRGDGVVSRFGICAGAVLLGEFLQLRRRLSEHLPIISTASEKQYYSQLN